MAKCPRCGNFTRGEEPCDSCSNATAGIQCQNCNAAIPEGSKFCGKCGKAAKRSTNLSGCLVVGIIGIFAWLMVGRLTDSSDNIPDNVRPEPAMSVTADALLFVYRENEVAADRQYKDSPVSVSGAIRDIGKDILGNPYVVLGPSNAIMGVQCIFPKSAEVRIAAMSKGQQVKFNCTGKGKLVNVVMECR